MRGFLGRLTGVIHWIGFGISLALAYTLFTSTNNNGLAFNVLITLTPNTVGWLIKYIFIGNGKYLPF
tara:strand:+ start:342 stop:542 length:201 start_codon:yes stop_codon:yes gene_type:complete